VTLGRLALGVAAAWGAYAWGAHVVTPACVWRGDRARRRIALTFDDGPDPAWTPRVLDLLRERRAPGSFFLVGERAARAPETVRRMAAEGHEVASHGWSHRSLWLCGPWRTGEEIGRTHALLTALAGSEPRHFRPPWGMVNAAMFGALRRHGERCVFWSIQPEGLRSAPPDLQVRHVLRRALRRLPACEGEEVANDPRGAGVLILYRAAPESGELRPGDDASEVAYFGPDELPRDIAFASTRRALARWCAERRMRNEE